jgi:hypothetical protein
VSTVTGVAQQFMAEIDSDDLTTAFCNVRNFLTFFEYHNRLAAAVRSSSHNDGVDPGFSDHDKRGFSCWYRPIG